MIKVSNGHRDLTNACQDEELSKEGEELGRRWQTLVADLALRAKEGEQVLDADAENPHVYEGE